jgi:hypothetical protein
VTVRMPLPPPLVEAARAVDQRLAEIRKEIFYSAFGTSLGEALLGPVKRRRRGAPSTDSLAIVVAWEWLTGGDRLPTAGDCREIRKRLFGDDKRPRGYDDQTIKRICRKAAVEQKISYF